MANETQIRIATPRDHLFIKHLQRRFTNEIGFIPAAANEKYIELGRVKLALENGEPAGMILGRDAFRWNIACRPITQAAIDFDAQRRHHGLALVNATAADAREAGQVALQACCREGLEANEFWRIAGFQEICRLDPGNARGRLVIVWRRLLTPRFVPEWFHQMPPVSGYRARKSRL